MGIKFYPSNVKMSPLKIHNFPNSSFYYFMGIRLSNFFLVWPNPLEILKQLFPCSYTFGHKVKIETAGIREN
jgi:hypothetical protein